MVLPFRVWGRGVYVTSDEKNNVKSDEINSVTSERLTLIQPYIKKKTYCFDPLLIFHHIFPARNLHFDIGFSDMFPTCSHDIPQDGARKIATLQVA